MSTDQPPSIPSLSHDAAPAGGRLHEPADRPRRHLRALGERRAGAMPLGSAPLPADWPDDFAHRRADGAIAGAIAEQLVRLLRKHTGRGPTKAKCAITEDLVVVTLADCLTRLETQLATDGNFDLVRRVRRAAHQGLHPEATAIVEELTQKQVVAYLTAQQHDPDLAVLIFYLATPSEEGAG